MKVTENHIQELYKFTRQHYVEHYDVQTELVDHLANDIEQICNENPNLSFQEARDKSFKKFGVFGFMNVVDEKRTQMTKKYFKIILKFAKEWFRAPKIILTFLVIYGFYELQRFSNAYNMYVAINVFVLVLEIFVIFRNKKRATKQFKKTNKKWMFQDIIHFNGMANISLLFFYAFDFSIPNNTKDFLLMGDFRRAFSALLISVVVILGYITLVVIPQKAEKLLEDTYPEYKLS